MTDETRTDAVAEEEEFSAAAPPHPGAAGTGETSFGDAEAPAASELAAVRVDLDELQASATTTSRWPSARQADFENYRKRMARENAAAVDRGMAKLAKELLPALDHLELALKAAEGHEDVVKGFAMVARRAAGRARARGHPGVLAQGRAVRPQRARGDGHAARRGRRARHRARGLPSGYRINGAVLRPARVVVAG